MRLLPSEQPPGIDAPLKEWLSRLVVNTNAALSSSQNAYDTVSVTGDFTTSGKQVLVCKNVTPINVTLNTSAVIGDTVHIKRRDAEVTVIGTIDGFTNKIINVQYYSMLLYFDGIDWSQL